MIKNKDMVSYLCLVILFIFLNTKISAQTFLDKAKWDIFKNYDFNAGDPPLSNDWAFTFQTTNDVHQWDPTYNSCNDPNNVYTQDGILHIRLQNASPPVSCDGNTYNYTSGMLRSNYSEPNCSLGTGGYLYGMFEIRCKMAKGAGMYSTFWLSGHDAWPPEIDVFEYNGRTQKLFFSTDHWFTDHCAGSTSNCTNNITIDNNSKNITMPAGWGLVPEQLLWINYFDNITSSIDVNKKIVGKVISYNNATGACSLSVESTSGSGTYNSWRVCCEKESCNCPTFHEKQTNYGLDDEYHTYTLVWTPTQLSWFFDGKEIRTDNQTVRIPQNSCEWRRMDMFVNLWLNYPDSWNMPNFNNHFLIDYIKVYKPKTTNTTWDYKQNSKTSLDNTAANINSSVTNVSQSKFSIYTSGNNIFYKGTDSRLWNYWWNGSSFSSSCVNWNVTDINSDVTADAYNSRIWYRTSTNALKYFLNGNSNTTGVANCAGYITAAPSLSKVYYKGTDGKLWNYYKTSSNPETWTYAAITSSTNVAGGICINAAGTDIYYRGTNNNIYKVSWSGSAWQSPVQLNTNANVTDDIVFDEVNTKLYYRSSTDNRLYNCYYIVASGTWNTTALSWDIDDQDVVGSIAVDANKGVIYYLGTNNTLRHYYHDNGWNTGGARWYNSIANGNISPANAGGPIIVRNDGVVYYRSTGGGLYQSAWTNGEVLNPARNSPTGPYYSVYKKTLISNDPENNSLSINKISIDAYPNPSDQSLNFVFYLKESSEITLLIYDAMGNIVSTPVNKDYKDKGSHQYSFTNLDLKAGAYFFELKSKSWTYRGKIVRY